MFIQKRVAVSMSCSVLLVVCSFGFLFAQDNSDRRFDKIERVAEVNLSEIGLSGAISALRVTINPGTKTPIHTHDGRTSVFVLVQGILTEHRGEVSREYEAGAVGTVAEGVTHWAENKGSIPVIYVETNTTAN